MALVDTSCGAIVFCSSSGHCQLDCSYCIVNPVIKRNPSLTYEDLDFFMRAVGTSVFFIFSGKGDFFAGYSKKERLLGRLLERDVEVALDQCWDLLRQRRARRAAGLDPDDAEVRSEGTVETFLQ